MAQRVVANDYGDPGVLSVEDHTVPTPGPSQVHLRVRAAGVNPADVKSYSGEWGTDPAQLPKRPGFEVSGVVVAAGEETGLTEGEEVVAFRISGGYATDVVVPADTVLGKPAGLGWQEAAGLLLTGATATHALTATSVDEGDTVLVHGGSGGVGLMAVQLARLRGARVIATASPRNHPLLRELGADPVEYGDGLTSRVRELAAGGVDAALDLVGTEEAMDSSLTLVGSRDRIATIANFGRGADEGIRVLGGGPGGDPGTELRNAARSTLLDLAGSGRLRVVIDSAYPLTEVTAAHRHVLGGHVTGKVVLVP